MKSQYCRQLYDGIHFHAIMTLETAYNQSYLYLHLKGCDKGQLALLTCQSNHYHLSSDYCFILTLATTTPIPPAQTLNQVARIQINNTSIHGMISTWDALGTNNIDKKFSYQATLHSPLHWLTQQRHRRCFNNTSITQIIKTIISTYQAALNYRIHLNRQYKTKPICIQFDETDLAFISRLLTEINGCYYWDQCSNQLVITDHFISNNQITIDNIINCYESVSLNSPHKTIISTNSLKPQLAEKSHAGWVTAIEVNAHADPTANMPQTLRIKYTLVSNYQSLLIQPTPAPIYPNLLAAKIANNSDNSPPLDQNGCYKIQFSFNNSYNLCYPIKMLQPNPKTHLALPPKTPVAIGFIDGNIEQPIILGVINTTTSYTQHSLRTIQGNMFLLDDNPDQSRVLLTTRNQANSLSFIDHDNPYININSTYGGITLHATDINIETGNSYNSFAHGSFNIDTQHQLAMLANTNVNITSAQHIHIQTNASNLQTQKGDIHCLTDNFSTKAKNQLRLQTQQGDIVITSNTMKLRTENQMRWHSRQGDIIMTQPLAHIKLAHSGNLTIHAENITIKSPCITMYGDTALN